MEGERVKDINIGIEDNIGIVSLDSVILSKFLGCFQYGHTVMQSHALALSVQADICNVTLALEMLESKRFKYTLQMKT